MQIPGASRAAPDFGDAAGSTFSGGPLGQGSRTAAIDSAAFWGILNSRGLNFFSGVPDSTIGEAYNFIRTALPGVMSIDSPEAITTWTF